MYQHVEVFFLVSTSPLLLQAALGVSSSPLRDCLPCADHKPCGRIHQPDPGDGDGDGGNDGDGDGNNPPTQTVVNTRRLNLSQLNIFPVVFKLCIQPGYNQTAIWEAGYGEVGLLISQSPSQPF